MTLLQINKAQNVAQVELELERLQRDCPHDLSLPVKPTESSIGGESALIQLIITWAKREPSGRLFTHVQAGEAPERQLDRMVKTGCGFVACLMAKDVVDLPGKTSLAHVAYSLASARVDKMQRGPAEVAHGSRVLLAAVDHSTKWRLPSFYFGDESVRGRKEFRNLAETLVRSRTAQTISSHISGDTYRGLGAILHELIRNTHDWARTDVAEVPVRRSVRGILVDTRNLSLDAIRKAAAGSKPLESYVSHPNVSRGARFRCVELSIFDSGPGLAARWLGKTIDSATPLAAELDACMKCLQKHHSSSKQAHAGVGLYEVVRTLSPLRGFLRLRTGRLAMFRDFVIQPLQTDESVGASRLLDWTTGTEEVKEHAHVEGTLFTILIPLGIDAVTETPRT